MKPRGWLLLLPVLCACSARRAQVAWPAPDPRDGCFAGHLPGAELPGAKGAMTIQPAGLKEEAVRRVFRTRSQDLKGCFAAALSGRSGLSGWVQLHFTVGSDGAVLRSEIERTAFQHPELEACLGRALCRWRFGVPTTAEVTVSYPLTFTAASPAR